MCERKKSLAIRPFRNLTRLFKSRPNPITMLALILEALIGSFGQLTSDMQRRHKRHNHLHSSVTESSRCTIQHLSLSLPYLPIPRSCTEYEWSSGTKARHCLATTRLTLVPLLTSLTCRSIQQPSPPNTALLATTSSDLGRNRDASTE